MYYSYKTRKLAKKAKELAAKMARRLTLAGIVAGVGYNYYGARENVTAKVTAVDIKPAAKADDLPKVIVHTDKGTFVNEPTHMYLKDKLDTQGITDILRAGMTVELEVYGLNPKIGGFSREELGF